MSRLAAVKAPTSTKGSLLLGDLDAYLLAHTNETCAFQDLLQDLWGDPQAKRALEASIHRIRRAQASASRLEVEYIKNMRGVGYQLVLEGSSSKPNP